MTYRRWKFPLPGLWKGIDLGKDPRCWPRKRLESDHWPCLNDWFCLWLLKFALGCVFWLVPTRDQHDDDGCRRNMLISTIWPETTNWPIEIQARLFLSVLLNELRPTKAHTSKPKVLVYCRPGWRHDRLTCPELLVILFPECASLICRTLAYCIQVVQQLMRFVRVRRQNTSM